MSEYNSRVAVVLSIALLGFAFVVIFDAFEKGHIIGTCSLVNVHAGELQLGQRSFSSNMARKLTEIHSIVPN